MNKVNVLVIEDNPIEKESLIEVLEDNDYNIIGTADNFKDALSIYLNNKDIDLLIVDIFLGEHPEGILFAETINQLDQTKKPFLLRNGLM